MQTPDIEALERRAVACRGWRWIPGMLDQHGRRCVREDHGDICWAASDRTGLYWEDAGEWGDRDGKPRPDLSDASTRLAVLDLVRTAWAYPACWCTGTTIPEADWWNWWVQREDSLGRNVEIGRGKSEAEALVAALEAAP